MQHAKMCIPVFFWYECPHWNQCCHSKCKKPLVASCFWCESKDAAVKTETAFKRNGILTSTWSGTHWRWSSCRRRPEHTPPCSVPFSLSSSTFSRAESGSSWTWFVLPLGVPGVSLPSRCLMFCDAFWAFRSYVTIAQSFCFPQNRVMKQLDMDGWGVISKSVLFPNVLSSFCWQLTLDSFSLTVSRSQLDVVEVVNILSGVSISFQKVWCLEFSLHLTVFFSLSASSSPGCQWTKVVCFSADFSCESLKQSAPTKFICFLFQLCPHVTVFWLHLDSWDSQSIKRNASSTQDAHAQANRTCWCKWEYLHCTQATSQGLSSNLRVRPVWIGPEVPVLINTAISVEFWRPTFDSSTKTGTLGCYIM